MENIILFILIVLLGSIAYGGVRFAPWVPCLNKDLPRIFEHAKLTPDKTFYDLGCGTGKAVFYANKKYKATAKGIEIAIPFYLISKIKELFFGNKKTKIKFGDFYKHDISDADVVYLYGMNHTLHKKLESKLTKELKNGAKVISYAFPFENWKYDIKDKPAANRVAIYVYTK